MSNDIKNSNIHETAVLYKNIRLNSCCIDAYSCIGEDCDVVNTTVNPHCELGRRNLIRNTVLGRGSYTGTNTIIKNTVIGKYCSIAWNVSVGGGTHAYDHVALYTDYWFDRTFDTCLNSPKDLVKTSIGADCWIGAGANIVGGVTIGDGCVIGAGAVVTKDIEPYSIVVGIPGRVIKKRFTESVIEQLEKIKWWEWPANVIKENVELLRHEMTQDVLEQMYHISYRYN